MEFEIACPHCGTKIGIYEYEVEAIKDGWLGITCKSCHIVLGPDTITKK